MPRITTSERRGLLLLAILLALIMLVLSLRSILAPTPRDAYIPPTVNTQPQGADALHPQSTDAACRVSKDSVRSYESKGKRTPTRASKKQKRKTSPPSTRNPLSEPVN